jgi:hypothetical protein
MTLTTGDIAALARQAVDLVSPEIELVIEPATTDDPYRFGAGSWIVCPLIDGRRDVEIWVSGDLNSVGVLARVIDGLSDQIGETKRYWGLAFPPCPGHPHPAVVAHNEDDDSVHLRCPKTQEMVGEIIPDL